jgi:hypothetical protein
VAAFEVNSEPHTGARPSVRLCVGLIERQQKIRWLFLIKLNCSTWEAGSQSPSTRSHKFRLNPAAVSSDPTSLYFASFVVNTEPHTGDYEAAADPTLLATAATTNAAAASQAAAQAAHTAQAAQHAA